MNYLKVFTIKLLIVFSLSSSSQNTLLIIADDRSKSTENLQSFSFKDHETICKFLEHNTGGYLISKIIGNPKPTDEASIRLEIRPHKIINQGDRYSERIRVLNYNKSIDDENATNKAAYLKDVEAKVIKYKPLNGTDKTLLTKSLKDCNALLREFTYENCDRKILIINSDGIEYESKSKKLEDTFIEKNKHLEIWLVGWTYPEIFNEHNVKIFESKDGVIKALENSLVTTKN